MRAIWRTFFAAIPIFILAVVLILLIIGANLLPFAARLFIIPGDWTDRALDKLLFWIET